MEGNTHQPAVSMTCPISCPRPDRGFIVRNSLFGCLACSVRGSIYDMNCSGRARWGCRLLAREYEWTRTQIYGIEQSLWWPWQCDMWHLSHCITDIETTIVTQLSTSNGHTSCYKTQLLCSGTWKHEILIRSKFDIIKLHSHKSSWCLRIFMVEGGNGIACILTIILWFPRIVLICISFPLY